ncbi:MAG: superinfection immunity protein [Methylocystis sp.]|uniref:superinfection immunity protein n=1 Tax=Methylocystis sp. TaxID=1911079 RepID=UPI003DA286DD
MTVLLTVVFSTAGLALVNAATTNADPANEETVWIEIAIFVFVYFLPAYVAYKRNTSNKDGIFLLNLLFGWSVIGWFVALVMACGSAGHKRERSPLISEPLFRVFGRGPTRKMH